jgi:DinB superfamily
MLPEITDFRLRRQLETLPLLFGGKDEAAADRRPIPGKWSAREQLAHLARYHEVTSRRIELIVRQEEPLLDRYKAEDDPAWPQWQMLPLGAILSELDAHRTALIAQVDALPAAALERRGVHPALGVLPLALLLEFFLLHEAHHLLAVMQLLRAPTAAGATP